MVRPFLFIRIFINARNILMETAAHDICLKTIHISGKDNEVADSLSRFFIGDRYKERV